MARPRIFLSSTCFDLNDARSSLTTFLEEFGFEVLNSQLPSFGVKPKTHSHQACLDEIPKADYVVLIIGGRRGGTFIGSERSITNEEVKLALKLSIPVIAFVDQRVEQHRLTYKRNPAGDFKNVVDDVRVFDFIEWMASGHEDNWLHQFSSVTEVITTLKHQFAHYLHLYSLSLRPIDQKSAPTRLVPAAFPTNLIGLDDAISNQDELTQMKKDLRAVYDGLVSVLNADTKDSVKLEQLKAIWVIARHGDADEAGATLKEDRFKASAWGKTRGERVFNQLEGTQVRGEYDVNDDDENRTYGIVRIRFEPNTRDDVYPGHALRHWIESLVSRYGEEDALDMFRRADMRIFSAAERNAKAPDTGTTSARKKSKRLAPARS